MKYSIIYIVFLLFAILLSCDDEKITEPEPQSIEVHVKVCGVDQSTNIEINEQGAKLYVYYDFSSLQLIESTYEGQGEFVYEGSVIKPSAIYETDQFGSCTIIPKYPDKSLLIVVESRFNNGRLSYEYYDILKESASIKFLYLD